MTWQERTNRTRLGSSLLILFSVCAVALVWKWYSFPPDLSAFYMAAHFYGTGQFDLIESPLPVDVLYLADRVRVVVTGTCPADIDHDGIIGVNDLVAVIVGWGDAGGPADVDGDGDVDVDDLNAVIIGWGACV